MMVKFWIYVYGTVREQGESAWWVMPLGSPVADRKTVLLLFLALRETARKELVDRNATLEIQTMELKELLDDGQRTFENKTTDKTIDWYKTFSRNLH